MSIWDPVIEWLKREKPVATRPNHHEALRPEDEIESIKGIPVDHFWSKCEENLPDDWGITLYGVPTKRGMLYQAYAALIEDDKYTDIRQTSRAYSMPEYALEELFYRLRDML